MAGIGQRMINPTLKRLGLTQTEAAAILGISHHTLSRYARNALPAPRWLVLILAAWEACPNALAKAREDA
jgi:ABC-type sulfate transport system permease subunit